MKLRELYQFYSDHPERLDEAAEEVLWVDESRIAELLASHAADYFYWSNLYAIAKYELEKAEHHMKEVVLVDCRAKARDELENERRVRPTKDVVEEQALSDSAYKRACEQYNRVKYIYSKFAEFRQALSQRSDMLQALNARHCKELNFYGDQEEIAEKLRLRNESAKSNQQKARNLNGS